MTNKRFGDLLVNAVDSDEAIDLQSGTYWYISKKESSL